MSPRVESLLEAWARDKSKLKVPVEVASMPPIARKAELQLEPNPKNPQDAWCSPMTGISMEPRRLAGQTDKRQSSAGESHPAGRWQFLRHALYGQGERQLHRV